MDSVIMMQQFREEIGGNDISLAGVEGPDTHSASNSTDVGIMINTLGEYSGLREGFLRPRT